MNDQQIKIYLNWLEDAIKHGDRIVLQSAPTIVFDSRGDGSSFFANITPLEILKYLLEENIRLRFELAEICNPPVAKNATT